MIERVRRFAADCDPHFAADVERIADNDEYPAIERLPVDPPDSIRRTVAELSTQPPSARALLGAIQARRDMLRWYPAPATVPTHLLDRLAAAELVGPDGERRAEHDRLGIFVMEAATDFPSHRHSASEFYAVVAGTATWVLDDREVRLDPCDVIEVPTRAWHAIRTGPQPMLCCYLWKGTVEFNDYEFSSTEASAPT